MPNTHSEPEAHVAGLIVEGLAEFDLISDRRVFVRFGLFSANVPELTRGFQVDSPSVALADLGTQFGLAVRPPTAPGPVNGDAAPASK